MHRLKETGHRVLIFSQMVFFFFFVVVVVCLVVVIIFLIVLIVLIVDGRLDMLLFHSLNFFFKFILKPQ